MLKLGAIASTVLLLDGVVVKGLMRGPTLENPQLMVEFRMMSVMLLMFELAHQIQDYHHKFLWC